MSIETDIACQWRHTWVAKIVQFWEGFSMSYAWSRVCCFHKCMFNYTFLA